MSNYDKSKTYRTDSEILLNQIVKNTDDLEINLGDVDVNLEALETLQTATNTLLTGIDADTNAIKVDIAAVEVLLTGIDADTNTTKISCERFLANQRLNMGNSGSVTIAGNAAQSESSGTYFAVYFVKDTTPTTLTITNSTTVTGQLYPAGTWIYGDITAITGDSSGMYTLYKGAIS
tara:strand:+ start:2421 stop:2951 length:531 start_codon:yes stop_codon:yes gene_type:complete